MACVALVRAFAAFVAADTEPAFQGVQPEHKQGQTRAQHESKTGVKAFLRVAGIGILETKKPLIQPYRGHTSGGNLAGSIGI